MRNGFLASLPSLLVTLSFALGQSPQAAMPEASPADTAPKSAPAEADDPGPAPPHDLIDDLASHLGGTCGCSKGNVLTADLAYLFWALRNANVPAPLASTNAVGATGNEVLIGGHDLSYNHRPSSGLRLSLAYWLEDPQPDFDWDRPRTLAIEGNYLFLGERGLAQRNDTSPVLVRPFFALNTRTESGAVIAAPGVATGGVLATANYGLWGGELNVVKNIYYDYPGRIFRLDVLAGFRYLDLGEDLSVTSQSVYTQSPPDGFAPFAGNRLLINDLFGTRNQFYGGQIGAAVKFFLEALDLTISCKVGFGENLEEIHIDGFQSRTFANGATVPTAGGLLALASNMGRFHGDQFAVVPEINVLGSYAICRHISLNAGYTFLYWGRVARPGDQIDRAIDITQIPNFPATTVAPTGVARPSVPFKQTDFWAQGLTVGLQIVW